MWEILWIGERPKIDVVSSQKELIDKIKDVETKGTIVYIRFISKEDYENCKNHRHS